jgi:NAD+ synthase
MISDRLKIDSEQVATQISEAIRDQVLRRLRRRGAVIGLSGGVDSSVTATLCARALGRNRVLGLLMPEEDSDPDSLRLGRLLAEQLDIQTIVEDIAPILRAMGCYCRRDEFIRQVVPKFGPGYRCKLVLPSVLDGPRYNISSLVVESPEGKRVQVRMAAEAYLGIVAASNMKQRTRKQIEYYHADRLNYCVAGTPNRLEYDQGFFVKNGDGAADLKPIAHLYKSQVYELAEFLGVPQEIRRRAPTTDTFSLAQTQEEFYFSLPYDRMDLCLHALNHGLEPAEIAAEAGLTPEQVEWVFRDLRAKRRATEYHHLRPLLVEDVPEVGS